MPNDEEFWNIDYPIDDSEQSSPLADEAIQAFRDLWDRETFTPWTTTYTIPVLNQQIPHSEEESMPIDYNNLSGDELYYLQNAMETIDRKLSIYSNSDVVYVREQYKFTIEGYRISIVPEFACAPGATDFRGREEIRRLKIDFEVPAENRLANTRYVRYLKYDIYMDWPNVHEKVMEGIRSWGSLLKIATSTTSELLSDEEIESENLKIFVRKAKMDELKEKAQQTYERFMKLLSEDVDAKIDSSKEDEIINLTLPNNVKMRLNFYGDTVNIQEVELPVSFTQDKTQDFVSLINQFNNIVKVS